MGTRTVMRRRGRRRLHREETPGGAMDNASTSAGAVGRHEFQRVASRSKMTVSQPGEASEVEAERVADQIMRQTTPDAAKVRNRADGLHREAVPEEEEEKVQTARLPAGTIARDASPEEDEEKAQAGSEPDKTTMAREAVPEEEEEQIQAARKASGDRVFSDAATLVRQTLQRNGQPLDPAARAFLEPRFGHDFSQVRIHTDSQASRSTESVAARAYTVGKDIVFREGQYNPTTESGRRLLAHELTHTIQQGAVNAAPRSVSAGTMLQRDPTPAPAPAVAGDSVLDLLAAKDPAKTREAMARLRGWMKMDLITLRTAAERGLLNDIDLDMAASISGDRLRTAIEAARRVPFSERSRAWLRGAALTNADQVAEIRDSVGGPDAMDNLARPLVQELTNTIQSSYRSLIQTSAPAVETDGKTDPKKVAIPGASALPPDLAESMSRLKALSPLAAIQLQAVLSAEADMGRDNAAVAKEARTALGLDEKTAWCGAFAEINYQPLGLNSSFRGAFAGVGGLDNYFNYAGKDQQKLLEIHQQRGSVRKFIHVDSTSDAGSLDIRPGDIILNDWVGQANADHIQMVQSYDPANRMIFYVDGNGGGFKVRNGAEPTNETTDVQEKREATERQTGIPLGDKSGSGHVGVGEYNMDNLTTKEQADKEVANNQAKYGNSMSPDPNDPKQQIRNPQWQRTTRIYGIGRPSLYDFDTK